MKAELMENISQDKYQTVQKIQTPSSSKPVKKYNRIAYDTRLQLIDRVVFQGERLSLVAETLNVKLSTAKFIVKCFKKEGKIFKKHGSYFRLSKLQKESIMAHESKTPAPQPPAYENIIFPVYVYIPIYQTGLPMFA